MARNFGRNNAILGHDAQATATGTTGTVSGSVYDLNGYDGIVFMAEIGATATNKGLKALVSSASGGTFSDLAGTWATGQTSCILLEITKPQNYRYIKPQLILGTSCHHGGIWAIGVGPRKLPTTGHMAAVTYKQVNSPTTGTATSS